MRVGVRQRKFLVESFGLGQEPVSFLYFAVEKEIGRVVCERIGKSVGLNLQLSESRGMFNDLVKMISQERLRNLAQLFPGGPKPLLGDVVVPSDLLEQRSDGFVRG
jgi:hypothetical protein